MTTQARAKLNDRFNQLLDLHCFGKAKPEDEAKLERYQKIRKIDHRTPQESHADEVSHYQFRMTMKRLGAAIYQAQETIKNQLPHENTH